MVAYNQYYRHGDTGNINQSAAQTKGQFGPHFA